MKPLKYLFISSMLFVATSCGNNMELINKYFNGFIIYRFYRVRNLH